MANPRQEEMIGGFVAFTTSSYRVCDFFLREVVWLDVLCEFLSWECAMTFIFPETV
jgi:hypothetical protein